MVLLAYRTIVDRRRSRLAKGYGLEDVRMKYSADGSSLYPVLIGMHDLYVAGSAGRPRLFASVPEPTGVWMFGVEPYARHKQHLRGILLDKFRTIGMPAATAADAVDKLWDEHNWYIYAAAIECHSMGRLLQETWTERHVFEKTPSYAQQAASLKQTPRDVLSELPFVGSLVMLSEATAGVSIFGDPLSTEERILLGISVALSLFGGRRLTKGGAPRQATADELMNAQPKLTKAEAELVADRVQSMDQADIDAVERLVRKRQERPLTPHELDELAALVKRVKRHEVRKLIGKIPTVARMKIFLREWRIHWVSRAVDMKFGKQGYDKDLHKWLYDLEEFISSFSKSLGRVAPPGWKWRYDVRKMPNGYKMTMYMHKSHETLEWPADWMKAGPATVEKWEVDLEAVREVRGIKDVPASQIQADQTAGFVASGQITDLQEIFVPEELAEEFFEGFPYDDFYKNLLTKGTTGGGFE